MSILKFKSKKYGEESEVVIDMSMTDQSVTYGDISRLQGTLLDKVSFFELISVLEPYVKSNGLESISFRDGPDSEGGHRITYELHFDEELSTDIEEEYHDEMDDAYLPPDLQNLSDEHRFIAQRLNSSGKSIDLNNIEDSFNEIFEDKQLEVELKIDDEQPFIINVKDPSAFNHVLVKLNKLPDLYEKSSFMFELKDFLDEHSFVDSLTIELDYADSDQGYSFDSLNIIPETSSENSELVTDDVTDLLHDISTNLSSRGSSSAYDTIGNVDRDDWINKCEEYLGEEWVSEYKSKNILNQAMAMM